MGGGATKLGRSNPWQSKSAIHSASLTSVLRPGTFLTCCALATTISKAPSKTKGRRPLPVHPGALHGYLGATFREQPFPQAQQLARARAQCPNLLLNLPIPQSNQQTGHHGSLMHSEPTTAFYQGLHDASIAGRLLRRRPGADTAIRPSRFRV